MTIYQAKIANKKQYIENSAIILVAFATAFYPRILQTLGAPSIINFVHFGIVPLALIIALFTNRSKSRNQIAISWEFLFGLLLLLGVITASALFNNAGVVNVILEFFLYGEPFILVLAIVCTPIASENLEKFKKWFLWFCIINFLLAVLQSFLINSGVVRIPSLAPADGVQGVFFWSGAGNSVSATVSLSVAIDYFINSKKAPLWLRILALAAALYQIVISDSKQMIIGFFGAWFLLILTEVKNIIKLLTSLILLVLAGITFWWSMNNIEAFSAFKMWADRLEIFAPGGEAFQVKTAAIRIILPYYKSPLYWLFGLGPGHTVGRLGGWLLKDYWSLLAPLGATIHPVSAKTWEAGLASWLFMNSTFFSPFYGWVGMWGDIGVLGIGAYLYLNFVLWSRVCVDRISKLLILTVFLFGFMFVQTEEPGYMLSLAVLFGLRWQERRIALYSRHGYLHLPTDVKRSLEVI
jgi:hypothetical protein